MFKKIKTLAYNLILGIIASLIANALWLRYQDVTKESIQKSINDLALSAEQFDQKASFFTKGFYLSMVDTLLIGNYYIGSSCTKGKNLPLFEFF